MKTSSRLTLALGIAGLMLLASAVGVWIDKPEFGTTMIFVLIALAAAMGLFSSGSSCDECKAIRKLFGRKDSTQPKPIEVESGTGSPVQR